MKKCNVGIGVLLLALFACEGAAALGAKDGKNEKQKVKMRFADCPEAVRKTLAEESKGASIATVTKMTEQDAVTYEAEVEINQKPYEIRVAEDGTLIRKKLRDQPKHDGKVPEL